MVSIYVRPISVAYLVPSLIFGLDFTVVHWSWVQRVIKRMLYRLCRFV